MLKQNTTILAQYPFRMMGGTFAGERTIWDQAERRNKFFGGVDATGGTPSGHLHPSSWTLPQKSGSMSAFTSVVGLGGATGSGALGKNASATLTGSGTISAATAQLVISMLATLVGSGSLATTDLRGFLNAVATLTGSGGLTAAPSALAWAQAALAGGGTVSNAQPYATGQLAATLQGYSALTPEGIRDKVWQAASAAFNDAGTMGAKMNSAASSGDPWSASLPGSYTGNQAGALMAIIHKLLRNKQTTDPVTGKITVYDDDGVTVLLQSNVFEDVAGTQAYRGQGADRKDRLA